MENKRYENILFFIKQSVRLGFPYDSEINH